MNISENDLDVDSDIDIENKGKILFFHKCTWH